MLQLCGLSRKVFCSGNELVGVIHHAAKLVDVAGNAGIDQPLRQRHAVLRRGGNQGRIGPHFAGLGWGKAKVLLLDVVGLCGLVPSAHKHITHTLVASVQRFV